MASFVISQYFRTFVVGNICNYSDLKQTKNSMENTVEHTIRRMITRAKYGAVLFTSSFPQFNVEYVTKLLAQFEKEGLITRIAKGVYVKAKRTRFGVVFPSAFELVKEIAKRDKATVFPAGDTAANRLGFSTQVPMNASFLTSGSSRKLKLGNRAVTLTHGSPKKFAYKGKLMPELVQALRCIGENNITDTVEKRVAQLLSETPEAETMEHDLLLAPVWVRQIIKRNIKNKQ